MGFAYDLPPDRIALYPANRRDEARLLVYDKPLGVVSHHRFGDLPTLLSSPAALFLNDSAVFPARLYFRRSSSFSSGVVEILLLSPAEGNTVWTALDSVSPVSWRVLIGGGKRWRPGERLSLARPSADALEVERISQDVVRYDWKSTSRFEDVMKRAADVPLPPYLKREVERLDHKRYQTTYARQSGSVAAPTAGLHFTPKLLHALSDKGIPHHTFTLHVSGATFLPLSRLKANTMHSEEVHIPIQTIHALRQSPYPIAVGTTSLRIIESLYWYGCYLNQTPHHKRSFFIPSSPQDQMKPLSPEQSLDIVCDYHAKDTLLSGHTALYIRPPHAPRLARALITNFHQSDTSLLALVEALIGTQWHCLYQTAIDKKYRFLSYGDACLFRL